MSEFDTSVETQEQGVQDDSDLIYALQNGRVEQSGDPEGLYKKGGVYRDVVDAAARSLNIDKLARTIDQELTS